MYSDLIIGFDGSAASRDAVALGRRLARATGARPTVIYVRSPKPLTSEIPEVADDYSWGASVASTLDEARAMLADVAGATFQAVAETSVARVLHHAAEDAGAALIVLGATHRAGLGRVIPGTTADAVIHAAPCAVAIAPAGYAGHAETRPSGLIAVAIDGGAETDRVAHVAARIARQAGGTVRLVTVVEQPYKDGPLFAGPMGYGSLEDAMRAARAEILERAVRAVGADVEVESCVAEGDVAAEVVRRSDRADLLVIGSRGYGLLRRVLLRSSTAKILQAATCPVLVVPRRTAEPIDDAVVALAAEAIRAGGGQGTLEARSDG